MREENLNQGHLLILETERLEGTRVLGVSLTAVWQRLGSGWEPGAKLS